MKQLKRKKNKNKTRPNKRSKCEKKYLGIEVSPSTIYRVLKGNKLIERTKKQKKAEREKEPHQKRVESR
jgi:hypothetical protein